MSELTYGELHLCQDPESGLQAAVAIHSTRLGPALGGARYIPYTTQADAIKDALRLGRGMTYKAALAGLPLGGGKAVLIRQPNLSEERRKAQLRAFGRFVDSLGGRYITAEDSGTSIEDMNLIREHTRFVSGTSEKGGDPSPFTAYGVLRGIEAAAKFALNCDNLKGLSVAIQGAGAVGGFLARYLHEQGCNLFLCDVDSARAQRVAAECNAEIVSTTQIFDVNAEIFAPCALGGALTRETAARLKCEIVAGAANNQLATPDVGELLRTRNILYAPDYAINAGGLIHVAHEWAGYTTGEVKERCSRIYDTLTDIFARAQDERRSPAEIADTKAEEIIKRGR
jgi:leucine dehydrogenase